jgi:hypothetical protein
MLLTFYVDMSLMTMQFLDRPLRLFVYNHEYNVTRPIEITPSRHWGGQGALGCTLGYGALHKVPAPLEEPPQGPGETLFDTGGGAYNEKLSEDPGPEPQGEFLVPAETFSQPAPPPAGGPPPKKDKKGGKHHVHVSPSGGVDMDEYFKEGEEKSRAEDHAPTPKLGTGIPPPPKAKSPALGS